MCTVNNTVNLFKTRTPEVTEPVEWTEGSKSRRENQRAREIERSRATLRGRSFVRQTIQSHRGRCDPRRGELGAVKWRSAETWQGEDCGEVERVQVLKIRRLFPGSPRWLPGLQSHRPADPSERSGGRPSNCHRKVPLPHQNTLQEEAEEAVHANQLLANADDDAADKLDRNSQSREQTSGKVRWKRLLLTCPSCVDTRNP
jgi:hypothetical protein